MTEARAISDGVDLKALIERVRKAKGGDRFLDAAIRDGLEPETPVVTDCPAYTASTDDALGLVERVRPWIPWADISGMNRQPDSNGIWKVVLDGAWEGRAQTLPLAILLALLTSLSEDTTHAK